MNKRINALDKRNTSIDLVRILAVFCVISVHFFLHNGFYNQPVVGKSMYVMCVMRTLFSVCVPLFMIITGYLMSNKTLSKKYYCGIRKTIAVFVLSGIACMIFKAIHDHAILTVKSMILGTLDFTGANYSWYIEMYIGLFLLVPFLNIIYNKLDSQKHKQILVLTLFVLTILPTIFNIFNFDTAIWWGNPTSSDTFAKLVPAWWMGIYPITYYFVGCYLKEYGLALKTKTVFFLLVLCTIAFGTFNFYRSYSTNFKSGIYVYWYGIEPFVLSVLIFVLFSRIKSGNWNLGVRKAIMKVSNLVLGMYLLSFIFDELFYPILCKNVPIMTNRLPYYFLIVPAVFFCSMFSSAIIDLADKILYYLYKKIKAFIISARESWNKKRTQDIVFIVLIFSAFIFAVWKCQFGFGGNDEAFYLTVPHRLSMGDALFKDEWHLSQLSGILLMPFVSLYRMIVGSMDGIMLAARITYCVTHCAVAVFAYSRLRKYGYISLFGCVLYFVFTPFDIMALSYNTMALDLVVVTGILMATYNYSKKIPFIIAGFTFAGAVLCCPYLAVAYVLYAVCFVIHCILKNKPNVKFMSSSFFAGKTFLLFTAGAAILAAVFSILLFSRANINDIITNIPLMLEDPEHQQIGFSQKITLYFSSIYGCHPNFCVVIISYFIMLVFMIFDKARKNHRSIYLIASCALTLLSYVFFLQNLTVYYFNAIMFPFIFIGITSYILCNKKPKELFYGLFLLGIIYSFAVCFTSNQYFYIISVAVAASNIASFAFAGILIKEIKANPDEITYGKTIKISAFALMALVLVVQTGMQINTKATHCFWDSSPQKLNSQIITGPAKGIYTTADNCNSNEIINDDLQGYYKTKKKGNILFLTEKTWCYLAANDFSYGTYSAWLSGENETSIKRLEHYYEINPDKIPEYIYIPKASKWNFSDINNKAAAKGYTVSQSNASYRLDKIH